MIDSIGGVTSQLIKLALDATLLRHQVTAHNIANVNTEGYMAKRLNFEELLTSFSTASIDRSTDTLLKNEVESLRLSLKDSQSMVYSTNDPVQLDREMIELTENVLRYRALLEANNKRGDLLKMAISEGRS
ncbi:MAG: flagellar basal body rod protein FlgB [Gammaproteobacteria bacterium]|nr:flagellar basal body rod protein FlgB [Gammaproteobacteria bacterium]